MNLLLNPRGTNGSGKSYGVRDLLSREPRPKVIQEGKDQVTFLPSLNTYIIGKYSAAGTGGLDWVSDFARVRELVAKYIELGHVVMEGLLWSGVFKSSLALDEQVTLLGHRYVWIYVNTPYETCVDQIMRRRAVAGNADDFKPENVWAKHTSSIRCFNKAVDADRDTVYLESGCVGAFMSAMIGSPKMDIAKIFPEVPYRKTLVNAGAGKYEGAKVVKQTNPVKPPEPDSSSLAGFF